MNDETYSMLSRVSWKAEEIASAAQWLRQFLAAHLKGHQTWRTKDLFEALEVAPEQASTVANGLYKIRKSGLVGDCFRRDETKRHMGKPLVIWQAPLHAGDAPQVTEEDF